MARSLTLRGIAAAVGFALALAALAATVEIASGKHAWAYSGVLVGVVVVSLALAALLVHSLPAARVRPRALVVIGLILALAPLATWMLYGVSIAVLAGLAAASIVVLVGLARHEGQGPWWVFRSAVLGAAAGAALLLPTLAWLEHRHIAPALAASVLVAALVAAMRMRAPAQHAGQHRTPAPSIRAEAAALSGDLHALLTLTLYGACAFALAAVASLTAPLSIRIAGHEPAAVALTALVAFAGALAASYTLDRTKLSVRTQLLAASCCASLGIVGSALDGQGAFAVLAAAAAALLGASVAALMRAAPAVFSRSPRIAATTIAVCGCAGALIVSQLVGAVQVRDALIGTAIVCSIAAFLYAAIPAQNVAVR